MSRRPYLFFGSSSEGLRVARVAKDLLQADGGPPVDVETWPTAFKPGDTYIEALERAIERVDFAVLLLTDDEEIVSRFKHGKAPLDNVVFELGLFIGRVGRQRCYQVHDKDIALKLPSDCCAIALGRPSLWSGSSRPATSNSTIASTGRGPMGAPSCTGMISQHPRPSTCSTSG